ncbi:unnamed protein product [Pseudo-nitzschia multistriata]|uniref:Uncharacterized protein n=1 Tax=Pseudo-nitzschia multistriata TaxID=183589 RepID=A0A448YWA3_9STRA|nr:unnamed protein product [Pseudo-nitzschia multistriata]
MPRRSSRSAKTRSVVAAEKNPLAESPRHTRRTIRGRAAPKTQADGGNCSGSSPPRSPAPSVQESTGSCPSESASRSPSPSPEPTKRTAAARGRRGRPPLAERKTGNHQNENKHRATARKRPEPVVELENEGVKKKPRGRPPRAASRNKVLSYAEVDSATDEETDCESESSADEDFGGSKKARNQKSKTKIPGIARKKRPKPPAKGLSPRGPRRASPSSLALFDKTNTRGQSPSTKRYAATPPSVRNRTPSSKRKRAKSSSATPTQSTIGVVVGLTPIQDSVSKVWKSEGDWRDHGGIDYGDFY